MEHFDPFKLSSQYAIDPAYSHTTCLPDKKQLSLWASDNSTASWIYFPGSLEAYLLERTRQEAYNTCLNVYHPGRFKTYAPILYSKGSFTLQDCKTQLQLHIAFNGHIHLCINGHCVLHQADKASSALQKIAINKHLVQGKNDISCRVTAIDGPPCFYIDHYVFKPTIQWLVSEDDLRWQNARNIAYTTDTCFPHQETIPEQYIELKPITEDIYDAGVELLARVGISSSEQSQNLRIIPGESLAEAQCTDESAREQLCPELSVHSDESWSSQRLAFRYIRIERGEHEQTKSISKMRAAISLYPCSYKGAFASSDEDLNKIWMHAAYTLRASMQLTYVDGLKRDRLPWVGDVYACNLGNVVSFHEAPISEYSISCLMSSHPDEIDLNGIICYSLFWVLAARDHLFHFGHSSFIDSLTPFCIKLINSLLAKTDKHGLLHSNDFDWVYIDWADVKTDGASCFLNCLFVMALDAAASLLEHTQHVETSQDYKQHAHALRDQCRHYFWHDEKYLFIDNLIDGQLGDHISRQCNAFAVLSGVCPQEHYPHILNNVLLNNDIPAVGTPYMKYFEARALAKCNARNDMLDSLRDYWGQMIRLGASTFWEGFNASDSDDQHYAFYERPFAKSLCHAWSCGPLHLLSAELIGLEPLSPGWKTFRLSLNKLNLDWYSSEVPTPMGPIRVSINTQQCLITIPAGTEMHFENKIVLGGKTIAAELINNQWEISD